MVVGSEPVNVCWPAPVQAVKGVLKLFPGSVVFLESILVMDFLFIFVFLFVCIVGLFVLWWYLFSSFVSVQI